MWPPKPSAAWASLEATRWAQRYDLDEFAKTPDVDEVSRYDAFLLPPHPDTVEALAARQRGDAPGE